MSLSRMYRPKKIGNVIGNASVINSLTKVLERNEKEIPHVYLLSGPSGIGKTTLARIIAKKVGCHKNDFREMDTASFRGIDTAREIRKSMAFLPGSGEVSVWLLDECHQLTKDAQEALLKGLEDTPSHVFFILATTEPEKLKKTLIRRCSHFVLEGVEDDEIIKLMNKILKREEKEVPEDILEQIASDSVGSPGVALSILDSIMDLDPEDMEQAARRQADLKSETIELCRHLIKGSGWGTIAPILRNLKAEPESVRRAVLGYCQSVLLKGGKSSSRIFTIMECFSDNYYDIGRPGLTMSTYDACTSE